MRLGTKKDGKEIVCTTLGATSYVGILEFHNVPGLGTQLTVNAVYPLDPGKVARFVSQLT